MCKYIVERYVHLVENVPNHDHVPLVVQEESPSSYDSWLVYEMKSTLEEEEKVRPDKHLPHVLSVSTEKVSQDPRSHSKADLKEMPTTEILKKNASCADYPRYD